jgi:hypothetical protein
MPHLEIVNVVEVTALRRKSYSDRIYIKFDGPAPFPAWPDGLPSLQMDVAQGTGVKYVRDVFNLEPTLMHAD